MRIMFDKKQQKATSKVFVKADQTRYLRSWQAGNLDPGRLKLHLLEEISHHVRNHTMIIISNPHGSASTVHYITQ